MRWFKHFTDNHRGQSIQYLLDELGHMGPCCYYFLVEMCAEKLERLDSRELTASDCEFTFHRRVVQSALRLNPVGTHRLLSGGSVCNLFSFEIRGDYIFIKMPILADLLEYDQKKSRPRTAVKAPVKRLEKNRIESEENREEKNMKEITPSPPVVKNSPQVAKAIELNENNFLEIIPASTLSRWSSLYPDQEFLRREVLKAMNWCTVNPKKRPRAVNGWSRFLSSWFERGWVHHVKTIPSQKKSSLQILQELNEAEIINVDE